MRAGRISHSSVRFFPLRNSATPHARVDPPDRRRRHYERCRGACNPRAPVVLETMHASETCCRKTPWHRPPRTSTSRAAMTFSTVNRLSRGRAHPCGLIVEEWRLGTPPEEIPQGLPHLTLAQVFAALAYYSDHQDEINAYIERNRIPADLKTISKHRMSS